MLTNLDLPRLHQLFVSSLDGIDDKLYHSHALFESHIADLLSDNHNFVLQVDFTKYFVFICLNYSLFFNHLTIVQFLIVLNTLLVHQI